MDKELKKTSKYQSYKEKIAKLEKQLEDVREWRSRLIKLYTKKVINDHEFNEEIKNNENEQISLEDEIIGFRSYLTSQELKKEKTMSIKEIFIKYKKNFSNLTYDDKRLIIQALVKQIVINWNDVRLELLIPISQQTWINKLEYMYGGA